MHRDVVVVDGALCRIIVILQYYNRQGVPRQIMMDGGVGHGRDVLYYFGWQGWSWQRCIVIL